MSVKYSLYGDSAYRLMTLMISFMYIPIWDDEKKKLFSCVQVQVRWTLVDAKIVHFKIKYTYGAVDVYVCVAVVHRVVVIRGECVCMWLGLLPQKSLTQRCVRWCRPSPGTRSPDERTNTHTQQQQHLQQHKSRRRSRSTITSWPSINSKSWAVWHSQLIQLLVYYFAKIYTNNLHSSILSLVWCCCCCKIWRRRRNSTNYQIYR